MKKSLFFIILSIVVIFFAVYFIFGANDRKQFKFENPESEIRNTDEKIEVQHESLEKQAVHPDSLPALMDKEFLGDNLKLDKILDENENYTRYQVSYTSEGFKISGIMNIPKGEGLFPIIILNHGYIDPRVYRNGMGLKREQDYLAKSGYAVFHSDYRNHAQSDTDPQNDIRPRTGYTEDVINAVEAIKKSDLDMIDKNRIGMLGHSMGGGVTLNVMVTKPDLVKAYVLLAPINAEYRENFNRWVKTEWPELAEEIFNAYGSFDENPDFWNSVSAINFFNRITRPVQLHQGDKDRDVPVDWSRKLAVSLEKAGKNIEYLEYENEGHVFGGAQEEVMKRTVSFFEKNLKP